MYGVEEYDMSTNCYCHLQDKSQFNKWIVEQLGPVILGAKPAEIMSFPSYNKIDNFEELVEQLFNLSKVIRFKIFYPPNGCMKILFYNSKTLDRTLRDFRNHKFLRGLGYSEEINLDIYLDILTDKLKEGDMPHEIGVFLGYPLKDVIGFMGHPSLKLTKVNRWRVYGNPDLSDIVCERILTAKREIIEQLKTVDPNLIVELAS